jgi:hypothetical protein
MPAPQTPNHHAFPHIARLTGQMVHNNGGTAYRNFIGVADPEADILGSLDRHLAADCVGSADLEALDHWLGSLSKADFDTVSDGEESEVSAILAVAPSIKGEAAADFINRIYEACI